MAGDWIKMRTDLYRDPKVCVMADALMEADSDLSRYVDQNEQRNMTVTRNVTRNACVGALLSVWGVMRHRGVRVGDDLACDRVSLTVLDDISDLPGFGEAMAEVRWVVETDDGLVFPRFFDEYNVEPDCKNKTKNAERQQRYRERKRLESGLESNVIRNVTRNVTVTPREEERRGEITHTHTEENVVKKLDLPEWVVDPWARFLDTVFAVTGRRMPATTQDATLMEVLRRGEAKGKADLEFSILKQAKSLLDSSNDFQARSVGSTARSASKSKSEAIKEFCK